MIAGLVVDGLRADKFYDLDLEDAATIEQAHKFLLSDSSLCVSDEVISYGQLLMEAGLCRPPFKKCWFEIDLPGGHVMGLLTQVVASPKQGDLAVVRAFFKTPPSDEFPLIYGRYVAGWRLDKVTTGDDDVIEGMVIAKIANDFNDPLEEVQEKEMACCYAYSAACVIALLDIKEIVQSEVTVKDRVNVARRAAGKPQLFSHKVLKLNRESKERMIRHSCSLLERRAHWRRGHLRHLTNKIVPIAPALVRGAGFVTKDYRL